MTAPSDREIPAPSFGDGGAHDWLRTLRRYIAFVAAANLLWEIAHLPLYTIWQTGTVREILFAVVHCTGGDVLIAISALLGSLLVLGRKRWPGERFGAVMALTVVVGVAYTVFSEWLNVEIRGGWAYSGLMPTLAWSGTGLSPLAQWIAIPLAGFWWARRFSPLPLPKGKTPMMFKRIAGSIVVAAFAFGVSGGITPTPAASAAETEISVLARETHFHGIAVDAKDANRLYLATHHGLFAVGPDGKASPISETRDDFMGFTPHPANSAMLYASGHPSGGGNLGFIGSTDGGRTWRKIADGVGGPVDFHQMDVSKADPNVVYGVHGDLQKSADGGRNWRRVGPAPQGLIGLAASSRDADTLYAATQQGLSKSTDGGRSWQIAHIVKRPATMVHASGNGDLHAFVVGVGLIRAQENDLRWQVANNGFGADYVLHFAVAPSDPQRMYAVTFNPDARSSALLVSRDGGASWLPLGAR